MPSHYPIQPHTLSRHDPRIPEYAPERLKHELFRLPKFSLRISFPARISAARSSVCERSRSVMEITGRLAGLSQ
jgi:hypothetical protein